MGGQACVFYGAAEFSRDCDIVILADEANLARLSAALAELEADCIAVPPFELHYLERGHAVHFRCQHPDARRMRVDVMTKMRGCDEFDILWDRRMTLEDDDGVVYELLGIEDLVRAKKTQRDKDWPMIRRLVDAHHSRHNDEPNANQVRFWLRESRTPEVLIAVAATHPDIRDTMLAERPLLAETMTASKSALQEALTQEEADERERDKTYWAPLKRELESLRRDKRADG